MVKAVKKTGATNDTPAVLVDLPPLPSEKPTHERIAERAYARWERGGRHPGMAEVDWKRAEEELSVARL